MKYILLCGTSSIQPPRQLTTVCGERIVDRTIRLLRQFGVDDIAITTTNAAFNDCDTQIINYDSTGEWVNAFYPTDDPVCYVFGDVFFSEDAIKTIVETNTDDIEFFASAPPFPRCYIKPWAEPFAFKVVNQKHLRDSIETVKLYHKQHKWMRHPIAWELWQIIKGTTINCIDYHNYTAINDYTCDVDEKDDAIRLEQTLSGVFFNT